MNSKLRDHRIEYEFDALEQDGMIDEPVGPQPSDPAVSDHQLDAFALELDPVSQFVQAIEYSRGEAHGSLSGAPRFPFFSPRLEKPNPAAVVLEMLGRYNRAVHVLPSGQYPISQTVRRTRGLREFRAAHCEQRGGPAVGM
ncbi:MAG TPA: hypothetical protein VGI97_02945 [Gemmatimonadaceae bacterium]